MRGCLVEILVFCFNKHMIFIFQKTDSRTKQLRGVVLELII